MLRGLEHYAPQFKEWSEWRTRPRCGFPLDFKNGSALPLDRLGTLHDAAKLFALRLRAHLAAGDSAAAYADFQDGFQVHRALDGEPMLISGLVRMSALTVVVQAVGDGLRERAWGDAELKQLADDLAGVALWQDFRLIFQSERAWMNRTSDELAVSSPLHRADLFARALTGSGATASGSVIGLIPRRVFRDNELRSNRYFDELVARVSADGRRYDPDLPTPSDAEHLTGFFDPYYFFLCRISLPVFSEAISRYVRLQTQLDEARLAIALERCRQARGAYPETLAELVPDFIAELPVDVFLHEPMIYRRADGGTFSLYGVGKNRTDDGGKVDPKANESRQPDDVWLYAPPPAP